MRGEELRSAALGYQGLPGDRLCAFVQNEVRNAFPWLTGREFPALLSYQAKVVDDGKSYKRRAGIEVTTPSGERLAVDSDPLREEIERASGRPVRLHIDHRGNHDSSYVSFITSATVRALCEAGGVPLDHRRFRMNFLIESDDPPFSEHEWIGKILRFGSARLAISEPDVRCAMVTIDPDTTATNPAVLKAAGQLNGACAGVYGNVLVAGEVNVGDQLFLEED
jgi:uncharacterized protein YcbX